MLPRVKITFANGAIGSTTPMDDGVAALITHVEPPLPDPATQNTPAPPSLAPLTPTLLTSLADLEDLGFSADSGSNVWQTVKDFYSEAPAQSKLWLMTYTGLLNDVLGSDEAKNLLRAAQGEIRILLCDLDETADTESLNESNNMPALLEAQTLCQWATDQLYAPCMAVIAAHSDEEAQNRPDLTQMGHNRVCMIDGCTDPDRPALKALGLFGGRLASIPVQRSMARVKTGAIKASIMYLQGTAQDGTSTDRAELRGVNTLLHDKGYIVPRTFVGKTGYYWSDDLMACPASDDYSLIPRRRTIDKAYRVAYKTLVEEIAEEIPVTDQGTPAPAILKAIETKVESAIVNNMTSLGNLGTDPADPNDLGVQCHIDPDQNILATSRLEIALRVKPYGYAKYIDVTLGFLVEQ